MGIDILIKIDHYGFRKASYAIKDHLNSVIAMVNAQGEIVESYTYDAFGTPTIYNAAGEVIPHSRVGNRYMFQGREYERHTGLYYFRALV